MHKGFRREKATYTRSTNSRKRGWVGLHYLLDQEEGRHGVVTVYSQFGSFGLISCLWTGIEVEYIYFCSSTGLYFMARKQKTHVEPQYSGRYLAASSLGSPDFIAPASANGTL